MALPGRTPRVTLLETILPGPFLSTPNTQVHRKAHKVAFRGRRPGDNLHKSGTRLERTRPCQPMDAARDVLAQPDGTKGWPTPHFDTLLWSIDAPRSHFVLSRFPFNTVLCPSYS